MYYLTVSRGDGSDLIRRQPFNDFAAAVAYTATFYRPKYGRCVLNFTTEVINGQFARSYAFLTDPESVDAKDPRKRSLYELAAKQANAFEYNGTYRFLIESDVGIEDQRSEESRPHDKATN